MIRRLRASFHCTARAGRVATRESTESTVSAECPAVRPHGQMFAATDTATGGSSATCHHRVRSRWARSARVHRPGRLSDGVDGIGIVPRARPARRVGSRGSRTCDEPRPPRPASAGSDGLTSPRERLRVFVYPDKVKSRFRMSSPSVRDRRRASSSAGRAAWAGAAFSLPPARRCESSSSSSPRGTSAISMNRGSRATNCATRRQDR